MLEIKWTKPIKKDLKKYKHQKDVISALQNIILLLVNKKPLPAVNLDHPLNGDRINHRECHVKNDVLLIYKTNDKFLYLEGIAKLGGLRELTF